MYYPLLSYPVYVLPAHPSVYSPAYRYQQPPQYTPPERRQYPEVDPTLFHQSAGSFKLLMEDADIILNKLTESKEFARKIMSNAQQNETDKVKNLIQSTGVKETVHVHYNPDAITFELVSKVEQSDCCKLVMTLRWR